VLALELTSSATPEAEHEQTQRILAWRQARLTRHVRKCAEHVRRAVLSCIRATAHTHTHTHTHTQHKVAAETAGVGPDCCHIDIHSPVGDAYYYYQVSLHVHVCDMCADVLLACVCVYVCVRVCVCVHVWTRVSACMFLCVCVYVNIGQRVHVCMRVHVYLYVWQVFLYTHTHTHTHTHTRRYPR